MKMLMITGANSGSGKTFITLGIIRGLKNRGIDVCGFKTGPDYIDTKFLEKASGKRASNLDIHLMGESGIEEAISMAEGEYGIVEGAMGYFDGIYNTFENSSYDISRKLDINAVLVYTPKGEMFSAIPKIKGMVEFKDSKIKGIILNGVKKSMYILLKEKIEEYIGIKVLGYVEKDDTLKIESRSLGLVQSEEIENIDEIINRMALLVEKNIDMNELIDLMEEREVSPFVYPDKKDISVAIAYDKAFSFYYSENLKMFENTCNIEYFSPLSDDNIPNCDLLYIGGGYPEVFKEELFSNKNMTNSIKDFAEKGGYIYAEGGGFMYLVDEIEGLNMCGIFEGKSNMMARLQRFGYIDVKLKKDCLLGKKGDILTAHEFHKSVTDMEGTSTVFDIKKAMGERTWTCGYEYKNVLAGYPHIHFLGNKKAFNYLIKSCKYFKERWMEICISKDLWR